MHPSCLNVIHLLNIKKKSQFLNLPYIFVYGDGICSDLQEGELFPNELRGKSPLNLWCVERGPQKVLF